MADNLTSQLSKRPELVQNIKYTTEPKYYKHEAHEDKLAILVSQIKIWQPKGHDWFNIPSADNCLVIKECESVEVTDSAKDLINKAVVRFPRGTMINASSKKSSKVVVGNKEDDTQSESTLEEATNDGEVVTTQTSKYKDDNVSVTSVALDYDDKGLIDFNRTTKEPALLEPNDVAIGNRIEIRLGYAYSESEYNSLNSSDITGNNIDMPVVFTGFITSVSVDTPLEIECTNMAHVLSCISAPRIQAKNIVTVKDFLDDDGAYHLLKDTGIPLAESSKKSEITVSGGVISDNLTVADVLAAWSKGGVQCIMETLPDGKVQLRVGLGYYAGKGGNSLPNNDKKYITYNQGNNSIILIQFDWDVAKDNLELKHNDKKYLAVEAHGRTKENLFFKLTVRKNPDNEDEGWTVDAGGEFQVVNERKVKPRKKAKVINGTVSTQRLDSRLTDHVKVDKYTVVPYFSLKIGITEKELIEEAKQYWAQYNPNGISGSIVIFGDLLVRPTDIVGLIDPRQSQKNGYYYVESVNTKFGIDGYRRELKIPYKIAKFAKPVEII